MLAAASIGFAIAIGRSIGPFNRVSGWFWCAAFIAAAVAGVAGGTFHAMAAGSQEPLRQQLWSLTMVSIGASGAFMAAVVRAADVQRKDGTVRWLSAGIAVTLIGAAVLGARPPDSALVDQNGRTT